MLTPNLAQRAADVLKRARDVLNNMEARAAGSGMQYLNAELHGDMFGIIHELQQVADQEEKKESNET